RGRGLRERPFEVDERVGEPAVGASQDELVNRALAGVQLAAHRIHAHPDDRIARSGSGETYVAGDGASTLRLRVETAGSRHRPDAAATEKKNDDVPVHDVCS